MSSQPPPGTKDPLSGQKWIFVEDSEFLPAHGGGEREHLGMLKAARDAGVLAAIVLPVSAGADLGPYRGMFPGVPILPVVRRTGPWRLLDPRFPFTVSSRQPTRRLVSTARTYMAGATGIVVTSYKSWAIARALADELALPVVLRMHNREGLYHQSLAEGSTGLGRLVMRWEACRIGRDESRLAESPWLNGIADISRADAHWRLEHGARRVSYVPPFAVRAEDVTSRTRPVDGAGPVLFIGALDVPTNTDAIAWFVERVWPLVLQKAPETRFVAVGRSPTPHVRRLLQETLGAQLYADVPDVRPFLEQAAVAVNPAVSGSGVNIKLVEYLAAGLPVVSTTHATRGLDLEPGRDLFIADEPEQFAKDVTTLLSDPFGAAAMGRRGASAIRRLLDERQNLLRVEELLQR